MKFHRLFSRHYRNAEPGDEGSGQVAAEAPSADISPAADTAAPQQDAPVTDPTAPAVDPAAPKSLLEAISSAVAGPKVEGQPDPAKDAAKDGTKPAATDDPNAPKPAAKPEDLTAMPEGLGAKAQERFRALATANKEITQQAESLRAQTEYVGTAFKENGITQPQFELAVGLIGAMNRGDWPTVIKGMKDQMRQVALLSGQPIDGIDSLSGMPDLQQAVENLQITQEHAAEIARGRVREQAQQRQNQQTQQAQRQHQIEQQNQEREQQAVQQATSDVDRLCADLKRTDLDYARIEAALLPRVPELFQHLPPSQWASAFQSQYQLLKSMGGAPRGNPAGTLRAGGADNPIAKPRSMHEAMFGQAQP